MCPQGIDIRDGQQLECITCALCIDACNAVMEKIGKPQGLISYATLSDHAANEGGANIKTTLSSFIRPRTYIYIGAFAFISLAMLVSLMMRERLDLSVLHDRNPVFVTLSDGSIRNGYTVKVLNMVAQPRTFELSIDGLPGATMKLDESDAAPSPRLELKVGPDQLKAYKVYVTLNGKALTRSRTNFTFHLKDTAGDEEGEIDARAP